MSDNKRFFSLLGFCFTLSLLYTVVSLSTGTTVANERYRVEDSRDYLWQWYNVLPFEELEAMCWTETEGFGCDPRLQDMVLDRVDEFGNEFYSWHPERSGRAIFTLHDRHLDIYGNVFQNDSGCWLWWWQAYRDAQLNPHPISPGYWISCP